MISFENRVAVITGAGRGLGAGYARLLASRGAAVVVNDPGVAADGTATEATPAEEVAAEIRAAGGAAVAEHSSVSTPEGGAAIVQKALDEFGRVDILINNAGILRDKAFHNLEWPNLDAVLDVHLRGAFYVTQPAFRAMRAQAYGRIVLTTSNAGVLGNFGQANYGAAKMGLVGLMNVLKQEGARVQRQGEHRGAGGPHPDDRGAAGPRGRAPRPRRGGPGGGLLLLGGLRRQRRHLVGGRGQREPLLHRAHPGLLQAPGTRGGLLTLEDVASHVEAIRAEAGYTVPGSVQDELQAMAPLLLS